MKRYVIQITITEGNDEFWDGLEGTGCDEVLEGITNCLATEGWDWGNDVKLIEFTDKD
jgi:hypothetical protein